MTGDALSEKFNSPVYGAGLYEPNYALLNPGKMVAELRRVALSMSIDIHENTSVVDLREARDSVEPVTRGGVIRAAKVVLATNAAPPLLRRLRSAAIPIFDYALVTRPPGEGESASIGWTGRHGVTHAWGGIIDTSARTTFFAGTAHGDRVAYAMGFTGQGMSASRFAALTMLDLLQGHETERTRLAMLRRPPFPFPPEPFRWLGIRLAQKGLAREDETGRRSLFNKTLDVFGIGFDS